MSISFLTINPNHSPNEGRQIINSNFSFITGGTYNGGGGFSGWTGSSGTYSIVPNNKTGNIANGNYSTIANGKSNSTYGTYSTIGNGNTNIIGVNTYYSFIGNGNRNSISAGTYSSVINGYRNIITGGKSTILNGGFNIITGDYSAILGGSGNKLIGGHSVIAGLDNFTGSSANTLFIQTLSIQSTPTDNTQSHILVINSNGEVMSRDASTILGTSTFLQNGLNTYTGGTSGLPTVNISDLTINTLTASGTTNFTGALQSGATDLSNIFIQGSGTNGTFPLWSGSRLQGDSIITQLGTGITVNGSVDIVGNLNTLGTASTFDTQIIQSENNSILLNFSGTHVSAIGGGITVLSGQPSGVASIWATDANGSWSANTQIIAENGLNVANGTLQSGGTDLSLLFVSPTNAIRIQPGSNIITGSTANNPTINLVASPSINNLTVSGTSTITTLSATTISATTYYGIPDVFGVTIDGGGGILKTGITGYRVMSTSGIINGWNLVTSLTGNIVFDIWKISGGTLPTIANTITASAKPTLTGALFSASTAVSTWNKNFAINDIFAFNIQSVTGVTWAALQLTYLKS